MSVRPSVRVAARRLLEGDARALPTKGTTEDDVAEHLVACHNPGTAHEVELARPGSPPMGSGGKPVRLRKARTTLSLCGSRP